MEDGLLFLCVTDEEFGRRIPFAFLEDIKSRFVGTYGVAKARAAPPLAFNDAFSRVLSAQMTYYSNTRNSDKISKVKGEVDELKSVMVENIEKVLSRGDRIENLVDKTENLESQAIHFKKQSTALKRSMWMKNCKLTIILIIVLIIVIYFAVAIFCGIAFQKCRKSSPPSPPSPPAASNSPSPSMKASKSNTPPVGSSSSTRSLSSSLARHSNMPKIRPKILRKAR